MTPESAIHIISQAFMAAFWLAAPLLLLGFAVGIVVNLVQVATSLQDAAFSTFPRLAAFLTGLILMMPWMLKKLSAYTIAVFSSISTYAR
ncbi:MAG TPA: flagellar biosynthetic protein FliQ [Bryobacteraceae bacterium]|jgi:flagellar biosynthetic protein FliQ|nr:flagellar biosynthetic protein FliQ [Bryobacteraceae bacterium]